MRLPTLFATAFMALSCLIFPAAAADDGHSAEHSAEHSDAIHVQDAYARLGPGSGAIFFLLHNNTGGDVTLVSAATDIAAKAELHSHSEGADGVMTMAKIEGGVVVAAGEVHEFARGGDHVMLMGLTQKPAEGATFDLTLDFADGTRVVVPVVVDSARKPGAAGSGMGHDMGHDMDHGTMHGGATD